MALAAHTLFGFGWTTAGILGAALAPTDPAVMFSVLGKREIGGRTGTILEGESGANDPVGIALMIGMLDFATHDHATFWTVVREFAVEMSVGLAIGVAGAIAPAAADAAHLAAERGALPAPDARRRRRRSTASPSVAHGSGFLAVFVAGLLVGDARAPYKGEIERFHTSLASLAEIVVFVALGLTIDLGSLDGRLVWLDGLLLALILAFVARPLACGPLLLPARLRRGERLFVIWGGLKGAVPILLAAFAVIADVGRRAADLRPRLRGRALLGRRAGHVDPVRRRRASACRCGSPSRTRWRVSACTRARGRSGGRSASSRSRSTPGWTVWSATDGPGRLAGRQCSEPGDTAAGDHRPG